ncbi:MAG: CoA transferase, partial [Actinomycetia bacterium]|nr:CoA transferase [Actinomycetes bacterium]
FTTHDGEYVMLLVLTARHWRDLTEALGIGPAIGELERCLGADFTRGEDRYLHRDLLVGLIAPWFRTHTYAETEARLKESSVLWSRYRSFQELTERDGPLVNNPLMNRIDQPGVGPYLSPGAPLQLDGAQLPSVPAPTLGEHTDALLSEMLEYSPHEIRSLHDRGIVG